MKVYIYNVIFLQSLYTQSIYSPHQKKYRGSLFSYILFGWKKPTFIEEKKYPQNGETLKRLQSSKIIEAANLQVPSKKENSPEALLNLKQTKITVL